tara:strand:+ start:131 stop:337 length:207 start_codon:yes stop_codon:yes gene_type:complete
MQVGDLVKLSSYGNKVKSNSRFVGPNDLGMIIKLNYDANPDFPYEVSWFHFKVKEQTLHSRQDLKHAR